MAQADQNSGRREGSAGRADRPPDLSVQLAARAAAWRRACPLVYGTYGLPQMELLDALRLIADVGYGGVELCVLPTSPGAPEKLPPALRAEARRHLADSGLALVALMAGLNGLADDQAIELRRLGEALELAADLGAAKPPVLVTTLGGRPDQWPAERERLAANVYEWAAVCARRGALLAIEPHVGGAVHRPEQADWLHRRIGLPALRCNYDHSHFVLRGISPEEAAPQLVPWAVSTHLKDARGTADKFEFLLPGEGDFNYPAFFRTLHRLGYRGPLTVEVSGHVSGRADFDPEAAARRCHRHLTDALDRAFGGA